MSERPQDVTQNGGDLFWYRDVMTRHPATGELAPAMRRACEDCWETMPLYVDHPGGLISPESDIEVPTRKTRAVVVAGLMATEALPKVVCLPCYLAAFQRFYPDAPAPAVSDETRIEA